MYTSPLMAAVSNIKSTTNQVNYDQAHTALKECLQSLCQPFTLIEGSRTMVA